MCYGKKENKQEKKLKFFGKVITFDITPASAR